jgi:outer membrane protein insertion porin family
MQLRIYAILLCLFILTAPLFPHAASDTTEVILSFIQPLPAQIESILNDIIIGEPEDSVPSFLMQFGYFTPVLQLSEHGDTLYITIGNRAVIRNINLAPERFPRRTLIQNRANALSGEPFSQTETELWIAGVLDAFEREGRPFAVIHLDSIRIDSIDTRPVVDLYFSFGETDEIILHSIHIEGNKETRDRIIYRQAGVFPGDRYSRERIENIRPRLIRTGLFRAVREPELRIDRGRGSLLVQVEEARFNSFDGIVGYVPKQDGDGFFTGLAHITMRNLFGTMRRIEFRWQRETELTQELFFSYREPFVAGLPVSIAGSFRQRQQDTSYVQTRTRIFSDTEIVRQFTLGVSYEYEAVIPSAGIDVRYVQESSSNLVGIDLKYDTRDEPYAPRSGMSYTTEYQAGTLRRRSGSDSAAETLQRFTIDAELFVPVTRQQVVKFGLYGREVRLNEYQVSDLFRFGGTRTLRGYAEGQFTGSRIAWSNIEYRFMTGHRSYLFGFFDTGYYTVPSLDDQVQGGESFEYGYGAGLQVETGIGLISIGFGFGRGDTFSTGKIHLGVINEF